MERLVQFRDRQEVQSSDLNNIGLFGREAIDDLVVDALTDEKRFTGFVVAKTGATSVSIGPGRLWNTGAVHHRTVATPQEFLQILPVATQKVVTIVAIGTTIDTNIEARDFLTDVDTEETEPQSVPMTKVRYVEFQLIQGTEGASPQRPTLTSDVVPIAHVTLSTSGVELIERAADFELTSIKDLDGRTINLESWRITAGDRMETISSDINALALKVKNGAQAELLQLLAADVARLKEAAEIDDDAVQYGADRFLTDAGSDATQVGYSAKVQEGLRLPDAAANLTALTLFNPSDPKVKVHSGSGVLLPDYAERRLLSNWQGNNLAGIQVSLSSYQFQTITWKLNAMGARRLRFGKAFTVSLGSAHWRTGEYDYASNTFTISGRTYQVLDTNFDVLTLEAEGGTSVDAAAEKFVRLQEFWYDVERGYYQERVTTDHSVSGSLVAQTFYNSQNAWLTSIDIAVTGKASSGDIHVILSKVGGGGRPNRRRALAAANVAVANVKQFVVGDDNSWTRLHFAPTAIEPGIYAINIQSGGNHTLGSASGESYGDGTLFYSTDGQFFQGDLTRDLLFRVNAAAFIRPRVEVDLASLSLAGGITDLDILAEQIHPTGTSLTFECRPEGSSTWFPVTDPANNPFAGLPVLVHFRAVFVGSRDVMPGIKLNTSRVRVGRPALALKWFTDPLPVAIATQTFTVKVILDRYREANHDFSLRLKPGSGAYAAAGVVANTVLEDYGGGYQRIERVFEWTSTQITSAQTEFRIEATGTLTAATEVFHVEQLVWLAF